MWLDIFRGDNVAPEVWVELVPLSMETWVLWGSPRGHGQSYGIGYTSCVLEVRWGVLVMVSPL